MKKLSLSNLSKHALDRLQQNAVRGGGLPSCVCGYICDNCSCSSMYDGAEDKNYGSSEHTAGDIADMIGGKPNN